MTLHPGVRRRNCGVKRLLSISALANAGGLSAGSIRWAVEKGRLVPDAFAVMPHGQEVPVFDAGRLSEVKAALGGEAKTQPATLTEQCLAAKAGTP